MTDRNPLRLSFARRFPGDCAAYLARQDAAVALETLSGLPDREAAAVVARLPDGFGMRVLASREIDTIVGWVVAAGADEALALLRRVDPVRRDEVLDRLPRRRRQRELRRLLSYAPGTVGTLIDAEVVRLDVDLTMDEAMAALRDDQPEPGRAIWLVDRDGQFRGVLDTARMLAARSARVGLGEFAIEVRPLRAETTLAACRDSGQWLRHAELPVVDERGRLLGSITRRRLMEALGTTASGGGGMIDGIGDLAEQYFRVLGQCIGQIFPRPGRRR